MTTTMIPLGMQLHDSSVANEADDVVPPQPLLLLLPSCHLLAHEREYTKSLDARDGWMDEREMVIMTCTYTIEVAVYVLSMYV